MTVPVVVVAGLGPAGAEYVTAAVTAAIARIPVQFVRTTRHPSAVVVPTAASFGELYEAADTFDDVYTTIVDRIVAAAQEQGEELYAMPGSPLVLQRTVLFLPNIGRAHN